MIFWQLKRSGVLLSLAPTFSKKSRTKVTFKVADRVRWVRAVSSPEYKNAVGTVETVIPNDTDVVEFTMYDIEFAFGKRTLYGTQIEAE